MPLAAPPTTLDVTELSVLAPSLSDPSADPTTPTPSPSPDGVLNSSGDSNANAGSPPNPSIASWCWGKVKGAGRKLTNNKSLTIGAIILALVVIPPAYAAWNLENWSALKDYIEYCQKNLAFLTESKQNACRVALQKGLGPPPYSHISAAKRAIAIKLGRREALGDMATLASIQALPPGLSRRQDLEPRGTPPLVAIAVAILLYIGISAGAVQARKLSRDRLIAKPLQWTMLLLVVLYPPSIIFYWYRSTESQKAEAIQKYLSYCESIKAGDKDFDDCTSFRRSHPTGLAGERSSNFDWQESTSIAFGVISAMLALFTVLSAIWAHRRSTKMDKIRVVYPYSFLRTDVGEYPGRTLSRPAIELPPMVVQGDNARLEIHSP